MKLGSTTSLAGKFFANEDNMTPSKYCSVICSTIEAVRDVILEIRKILEEHAWDEADCKRIQLAMDEALTNAVKHGNKSNPNKCVRVACELTPDGFKLMVGDEGAGFDPATVPNCTDDDRLEVPSGRGLLLMNSFMDSVIRNDVGNEVTMYKKRTVALATA